MLRRHRDSRAHISKEKALPLKTNRKEEHNFDSRKGKKEGGREGRKEGRQEERNKGLAQNVACTFQFTHDTFKELKAPRNLQLLGSKCGQNRPVYFTAFSCNTLQTPCNYMQYMCAVQIMLSTCCKYHSTCSFDLQKAAK